MLTLFKGPPPISLVVRCAALGWRMVVVTVILLVMISLLHETIKLHFSTAIPQNGMFSCHSWQGFGKCSLHVFQRRKYRPLLPESCITLLLLAEKEEEECVEYTKG